MMPNMKANFLEAYAPVKQWEGGWCNVSGDSGGETYAGISRNFFPDWCGWSVIDAAKDSQAFREGSRAFSGHLANVPGLTNLVTDWYRTEWWIKMGLSQFPQVVANELFEQAINLGRGGSGRYVQRLCNALNFDRRTDSRLFADLAEDGVLGRKSIAALSTLLELRITPGEMVHALNGLQIAHYIGLGSKNYQHRKFVDGWLTRTHD